MIDIVNFYKDKVQQWNDENKCGFCYSFGAPLFNSELNIQQIENCCLNVFLTNIRTRSVYQQNSDNFFGRRILNSCIIAFDLYLILPSELGINNYNEISGHPIEESKWETIFKPLLDCFGCGVNQCETIDGFMGYQKWEANLVHNYLDNVYNGIKVSAEIEIKY